MCQCSTKHITYVIFIDHKCFSQGLYHNIIQGCYAPAAGEIRWLSLRQLPAGNHRRIIVLYEKGNKRF